MDLLFLDADAINVLNLEEDAKFFYEKCSNGSYSSHGEFAKFAGKTLKNCNKDQFII